MFAVATLIASAMLCVAVFWAPPGILPSCTVHLCASTLATNIRNWEGELYTSTLSQMQMGRGLDAPLGPDFKQDLNGLLVAGMAAFRSYLPVKPEQLKT